MKLLRWIAIALMVIVGCIQFVRPAKNISALPTETAIGKHFNVPPTVQSVFQRSCNDCHSNFTVYPWYADLQPVGWWLNKHIRDGKRGLNFDEFTSYRLMKQYHRFNDIIEQLDKDEMPLPSYLLIHRYAKLTAEEKKEIIQWCTAMRDSMKTKYPVDSLERKPRK
jgi:hypothetical protein